MTNGYFTPPKPVNAPTRSYLPGNADRAELKQELKRQAGQIVKIPLLIHGEEVWTEKTIQVTMPHDHHHVIAECCMAGEKELKLAIEAALAAKPDWEALPWEHRAALFLKAADQIQGSWHEKLIASTMLGQSKTAFQAEIDINELADFLRFGVGVAQEIFRIQPENTYGTWNRMDYRPLEGFICAVSPFNFTSIGGNLPTAPAIVGNVALWKPARTAVLSNYYYMKLLQWCGLPAGVINFVPCAGEDISKYVLSHPRMAGFHFTGSTSVFQSVWKQVGENIATYASYPRLVGETGGKNFIFAHPTADVETLSAAIVRGGFEYQGQKCSACSRVFVPESLWPSLKDRLKAQTAALKMGDVEEFDTFMGAVIDRASFQTCKGYLDRAAASPECERIVGGTCDDSKGWFVQPTILRCKSPTYETMTQEIFGPIVSVYVYEDSKLAETISICDAASPYALTGAIFAQDRRAIAEMERAFRQTCGNFYINDKCTGAVVGQQPFGGARASGTNDKAGSAFNVLRWLSPRCIKETFAPSPDIVYPYMAAKE